LTEHQCLPPWGGFVIFLMFPEAEWLLQLSSVVETI